MKIIYFSSLVVIFTFNLAQAAKQLHVCGRDSQPIANAKVTILDASQSSTELKTDAYGNLNLDSLSGDLTQAHLSIEADGYLTTTFSNIENANKKLQLSRADSRELIQISGEATEIDTVRKDGKIDFAIVVPSMSRSDLVHLDVSSIISSESDLIEIINNDIHVPSNLSVPEQRESYIIPVKLEKPIYRTFVNQPGEYRLAAARGQFPLRQVVSEIRGGKSFFEVINHFNFFSGGHREVKIDKSCDNQNISTNQIQFDSSIDVVSGAIPNEYEMISLPMVNQGGTLFPSDMKRISANEKVALTVPDNSTQNVIASLLMRRDDIMKKIKPSHTSTIAPVDLDPLAQAQMIFSELAEMSSTRGSLDLGAVSIAITSAGEQASFLAHIPSPTVQNKYLLADSPKLNPNILPYATYVILSEIETSPDNKYRSERRFRIWESYRIGWTNRIYIPDNLFDLDPTKKIPLGSAFLRPRFKSE